MFEPANPREDVLTDGVYDFVSEVDILFSVADHLGYTRYSEEYEEPILAFEGSYPRSVIEAATDLVMELVQSGLMEVGGLDDENSTFLHWREDGEALRARVAGSWPERTGGYSFSSLCLKPTSEGLEVGRKLLAER